MPTFRTRHSVAGVLCGIVFSVGMARPKTLSLLASQQGVFPLTSMGAAYGPSPAVELGLGLNTSELSYRISAGYMMLLASRDTLPKPVHHASAVGEVVIPRVFDSNRFYVTAGIGVGTRQLPEGRMLVAERKVDAPWSPYGYYTVLDTSFAGHGARVADLIGRVGVGLRVHRSPRWNAGLELRYQAAYGIGNPAGVELDMRADEMVGLGLVVELLKSPQNH